MTLIKYSAHCHNMRHQSATVQGETILHIQENFQMQSLENTNVIVYM